MNLPKKYYPPLKAAIIAAGGLTKLAFSIGIKPQAIVKWKRIPRDRIIAIEKATGIPRKQLAPELYD